VAVAARNLFHRHLFFHTRFTTTTTTTTVRVMDTRPPSSSASFSFSILAKAMSTSKADAREGAVEVQRVRWIVADPQLTCD
jgi:hypothetical protein